MEVIFKTRIVNLDSRPERYKDIPEEMGKMGITDYERFSAFEGGTMGSIKSHIEVLRGAEGNLLVCEDDVMFLRQARKIFDLAMSQIDDFNMVYLGGNVKGKAHRYSDNLFKLSDGGTHTNHAILYSEECRNKILEIYNYETDEINVYDHWLHCVGQKMFGAYIISPMIAWQRPGYSDCRGGYMDYFMEMRSNEIDNMV